MVRTRNETRIYEMMHNSPYDHLLVDARERDDGSLGLVLREYVPHMSNVIPHEIERVVPSSEGPYVEVCCLDPDEL